MSDVSVVSTDVSETEVIDDADIVAEVDPDPDVDADSLTEPDAPLEDPPSPPASSPHPNISIRPSHPRRITQAYRIHVVRENTGSGHRAIQLLRRLDDLERFA